MTTNITLQVNGQSQTVQAQPDTPLLYVLRNQLALNGPKFGCGLEQCGACMILLEGKAVPSCRLPVAAVQGKAITTLEGLVQDNGDLHPVQHAFVEEQAAQCGYCTNGMVIAAVSLLNENSAPDEPAIRTALQRNLCRCCVQARVIRAVQLAAKYL
jgi:nicotinate dehydrogenase subunit A